MIGLCMDRARHGVAKAFWQQKAHNDDYICAGSLLTHPDRSSCVSLCGIAQGAPVQFLVQLRELAGDDAPPIVP